MIAKYHGKYYDTIDWGEGIWLISSEPVEGFENDGPYYSRKMTEKDIEETTFKAGEMPPHKPTKEEKQAFDKHLQRVSARLHQLGPEYLDSLFKIN